MNGPNLLTLLRIFFVPLLVAALLGGEFVEPYLAALTGPLAITREVQPQPAPLDITPAESDVLKDAKAS